MYWSRACLLVVCHLLLAPARATPAALSATPSTVFYGDDGLWSAISIQVGTPQQWVNVLVSTGSSETWVVSSDSCVDPICQSKRGQLFNSANSTTWQPQGPFQLGLDAQLGFEGAANYGLDTVEFGTTGISVEDSIIASYNTQEYWVGFFGVGIVPGKFGNVTAKSAISSLVENEGLIPSHSYGYTAGASYQAKGEPCSLTLGGYDANRLVPHNISFDLDPSQQLEAFIDLISVSALPGVDANFSSNPLTLMDHSEGFLAKIDSSTPFLWLPKYACDRFAAALGLTYNETLDLYTFDGNSSRREDVLTWGLNFTFSLANNATSQQIVNISLPYNAFDLQLTYPYINGTQYGADDATKNYFPLRPAANDTQYTIGRAFLQEAYMIVDYERNNFSVHQAVHISNPLGDTQIVDISRPANSTFSSTPASKSLPQGAIVGIAVGGSAIIIIFAALLCWWVLRRRRRVQAVEEDKEETIQNPLSPGSKSHNTFDGSDLRSPLSISTEVDSVFTERHEMYAPMPDPTEMDASHSAVPRTPRDGTEKVKFTTYQQALWRDRTAQPSGAGMAAWAEDPLALSIPDTGTITPLPSPTRDPQVPVQSAADFIARMIERKNGSGNNEDPPRTRGRRGEVKEREKEKERATEEEIVEQVRYASQRESWTPGDDTRTGNTTTSLPGNITPDNSDEVQPARTSGTRLSRSDSIAKRPMSPIMSPKVLVMGRLSFLRGRNRGMPE